VGLVAQGHAERTGLEVDQDAEREAEQTGGEVSWVSLRIGRGVAFEFDGVWSE